MWCVMEIDSTEYSDRQTTFSMFEANMLTRRMSQLLRNLDIALVNMLASHISNFVNLPVFVPPCCDLQVTPR